MQLNKREFLKTSLYGISVLNLTMLTSFAAKHDLGTNIVEAVKKITNGKSKTLVLLYPEGSHTNIQPIADLFTKQTGVKINFLQTAVDDLNTTIFIETASEETNFDIALPATFGIPDLVEAGALSDLSNFAKIYEKKNHFFPSLYDLGDYYKRKKYGYQTDGDIYTMFYNKSFLDSDLDKKKFEDKYGYTLNIPQTWEQLDQLMAFFHRPDKNQYGGCLFRIPTYIVWEWWIRFHAKGYFPFQDDLTPNIANDEGIAALEELIKATQYQHPSAKTNGLFENWREYAKGQCAVNIGWGGTQKYLNSAKSRLRGNMYFAPTPEISYFNWGWNYVVSKFSEQQEIAYLFCLYATLPKLSNIAVQQDGFFDPFRKEHYDDPQIENKYDRHFLKAHQLAMQTAIPDLYIQGRGQYINILQDNISNALEGNLSAKQALALTAKNWDKITDKIGRKNQIEQWLFLKQKYPKHLDLKA